MSKNENKLTLKQETFLLEYLKTGNASQAYRDAYDVEKMTDDAVRVEAHRLLQHPNIAHRLAELGQKAANRAVLDRTWIIERLMRNAKIALGEEPVRLKMRIKDEVQEIEISMRDAAAANKALELLGKSPGMRLWVEQHEHGAPGEFDQMSTEELRQYVTEETRRLHATAKAAARAANGTGTKH